MSAERGSSSNSAERLHGGSGCAIGGRSSGPGSRDQGVELITSEHIPPPPRYVVNTEKPRGPAIQQQPAPVYGKDVSEAGSGYTGIGMRGKPITMAVEGPSASDSLIMHTDDWPFGGEMPDADAEDRRGQGGDYALAERTDIPRLNPTSFKPIAVAGTGLVANNLSQFDADATKKHLEAIAGATVTETEQLNSILMRDERPVHSLEVCGIVKAPGLLDDLTRRCRLTLTSTNRLLFTQAKHTASVGIPRVHCISAFVQWCLNDTTSIRKFESYYGSVNASDVIQVFVQQLLTTEYTAGRCDFTDLQELLCCSIGGMLKSEKVLEGATQTLGDYDQDSCLLKRWDKERFMRHSLVIRYVNFANNELAETVVFAHPNESPAKLYQMAHAIEACKTITTKQWLLRKNVLRGNFSAIVNGTRVLLLHKRSYKALLLVMLAFTLGFFALSTFGAIIMILGLLVMLGGAFRQRASSVANVPMASQVGGALLYAVGFLIAVFWVVLVFVLGV